MKLGIYNDSAEEYNSAPHLRASVVKEMMISPGHFLEAKSAKPKTSKAFDEGFATHAVCLEQTVDGFVRRPDGVDGRTKEGKAILAELEATGKPVLPGDVFDSMERRLSTFANSEKAMELYDGANIEESHYVKDPITGLFLKARPDINKAGVIADFKTTRFMAGFEKEIWTRRYFVQVGFYSLVLELTTGSEFNRFCFIAQEKTAPYGVQVFHLDRQAIAFCKSKARELLNQIALCTEENVFPIYEDKIHHVEIPAWVLANEIEFESEAV